MNVRIQQVASIVLTICGLFVASVLSFAHSLERDLPCGVSQGCAKLAAHPSSLFYGVPVAYFGVAGYWVLLLMSAAGTPARLRAVVSGVGLLASAALTYVALVVVKATCVWCLSSAGLMLLLFTFNVAPVEGGHRLKPMVAVVASIVGIGFAGYGAYVFTGGQRYSAEKVMINQAVLAEMTPEEIAPPTAHRRGSIGGPVKLVVLADLACAGCADLHRRLESLTTGLKGIEWVFRHRPLTMLPGHEASGLGAVCAEIAGEKGKFWEFVDAVYGGNEEPSEAVYRNELLQLGIKDDPIKRFNNPKDPATMRAQADLAFAGKLSIISTPTIIILVKGLKPIGANAHTLTKTMQRDDIASVLAEANPQ